MKVEVLDGLALVADERWEIVANCPDRTGPSIAFARGSGAIDADLTVEIVKGLDAISADRQVCVINPANLDDKTAELLKLKRETGLGDESPVSAPSDF